MQYTEYMNLKKPEPTDQALIGDINDNMDAIDTAINSKADASDLSRYYTKEQVDAKVSVRLKFEVVESLPATGETDTIYLVPASDPKAGNVKDEYIYTNGSWELIGSTAFVLDIEQTASGITVNGTALQDASSSQDGLMTASMVQSLNGKQDAMTAGVDYVVPEAGKGLFSGSYNDLSNKPTIPDELSDLSDDSTHRTVTDTEKSAWNGKQDPLIAGTDYVVPESGKGLFSGSYNDLSNKPTLGTASEKDTGTSAGNVPVLDSGGKLPNSTIPSLAIGELISNPTGTKASLLTLSTAEKGDIAMVTEETDPNDNGVYWLNGTYSTAADWIQIVGPGAVISVNGHDGAVVLDKTDVGLGNVDNTSDLNKPISTATQTALDAKIDTDGTGLSKSGTTLNHSAVIESDTTDTAAPSVGGTISYVDSITRDSTGHVTTVNVKTATLPEELPSSTSSDADKVLTVDSNGSPAWGRKITISSSAPSGGSDGDLWFQYE